MKRFEGRERRVHRVFVTRNTEYHVRRATCVGVRDRRTGQWLAGHLALRAEVSGGWRFHRNGMVLPAEGQPVVGESLFFSSSGRDLVTSPVVAIERAARDDIEHYPH